MKKVTGRAGIRPCGDCDFEFFVEDNATKEEIEEKIDDYVRYYMYYNVEEGYEAVQETVYRKRGDDCSDDQHRYMGSRMQGESLRLD